MASPFIRDETTDWLNQWAEFNARRNAAYNGDGVASRLAHNSLFAIVPNDPISDAKIPAEQLHEEILDAFQAPAPEKNFRDVGIPVQRQIAVLDGARKAEVLRRQSRVQTLANLHRNMAEHAARAKLLVDHMLGQEVGTGEGVSSTEET